MTQTAEDEAREAMRQGGHKVLFPIDITLENSAVLAISDAITTRRIPGLYSRSGDVSQVSEIDDGTGPRLVIRSVDADSLRMLLAQHTACFRNKVVKRGGADKVVPTPGLPPVTTAKAVLSQNEWPGLPVLAGVTSMPMIRPDGTVLCQGGYDRLTRLYYRPAFPVRPVPDEPTDADVRWAREYVLGYVLHDFTWDSPASAANYLGLLVTPILRLFYGGLAPLGVISATTRSSGKSLLMEVMKALYGLKMHPWVRHEDEMAKTITSILSDNVEPVVVFDNVDVFDTVNHPSLAALLTMTEWSSRVLGSTSTYTGTNDRLWCVTGNNVAIGGDIASRSVLVRLDPQMERPEKRSGFKIDNMWSWLECDDNRAELLYALLVLARAWVVGGAPRETTLRMRNFSAWAQAMGGFTAFHGVEGFLANSEELATGSDDEETSTIAFLAKWYVKFQSTRQRSTDLLESARGDTFGGSWIDPWDGVFPTKGDGKPFSTRGMGRFLAARRGRIFGGLVLRGDLDPHTKVWRYFVEPAPKPGDEQ